MTPAPLPPAPRSLFWTSAAFHSVNVCAQARAARNSETVKLILWGWGGKMISLQIFFLANLRQIAISLGVKTVQFSSHSRGHQALG